MLSPPLVGLTGRAGAGKDTVAARLITHHDYKRVAFADPLRGFALQVDPLVAVEYKDGGYRPRHGVGSPDLAAEQLSARVRRTGWDDAKQIPAVRALLQEIGTGIRALDGDFWLRLGLRQIAKLRDAGRAVVVTDIRFNNELNAIIAMGGRHIHVEREGSRGSHVSETELARAAEYAREVIYNSGTIEELHQGVDSFATWSWGRE